MLILIYFLSWIVLLKTFVVIVNNKQAGKNDVYGQMGDVNGKYPHILMKDMWLFSREGLMVSFCFFVLINILTTCIIVMIQENENPISPFWYYFCPNLFYVIIHSINLEYITMHSKDFIMINDSDIIYKCKKKVYEYKIKDILDVTISDAISLKFKDGTKFEITEWSIKNYYGYKKMIQNLNTLNNTR